MCVWLVGALRRPSSRLINIKLRLEPERQLAHIVGDSGLVGILVVVVVIITVADAAAGRAAIKTPAETTPTGVGARAQVATVAKR